MSKNPIFDAARGRASPELIASLFSSPDAYTDGEEYWTRNPLRGDGSTGSFSINTRTGMWSDFADGTKGDLIRLIHESGRASSAVKAAEMIVAAIGGSIPDAIHAPAPSHLDKPKTKPKAVVPVPEDKLKALNSAIRSDYAAKTHGTPSAGYTYRDDQGRVVFTVVRFAKPDGSKDIVPYHFEADGRWHEGQALDHGRPVLFLDIIAGADKGTPVLVVEGEKCAAVKVPGYLVTTWAGGALATTKTDWAPLEGRTVIIWPDADEPGLKAASAIAKRLPGATVLDIHGKPKGWDIADAVAEGVDPVEFIASCPVIGGPPSKGAGRPDDGAPFLALGYDKGAYYFMRRETRTIFAIGMGSFNASKVEHLGPLSWWSVQGMVSDQGAIKVSTAQDYLQTLQHQVGFFDPKRIRGAGVWRDHDGIVLNTGSRIVTMAGRSLTYDEYPSGHYYVPSLVSFGDMHGAKSTDADGRQLEALFLAQEFEEPSMAILAMGWALIASFAGVLKWRPHLWLTGPKGSGKSWAQDNLIVPIAGPFSYVGGGKDTEAGIRWALDQDARPAIFAEMEPKSKAALLKIQAILELARNSSDDGSGNINISQPGGGTKSFKMRSMFFFGSKAPPAEDDAITSRITFVAMRASGDMEAKKRRTRELTGDLMDDPGRFTRRIFHALPRILSDLEWLRGFLLGVMGSQRAADQVAPMIAAAWAVQSEAPVKDSGLWLDRLVTEVSSLDKATVDDEDAIMIHLLSAALTDDEKRTRTVAEVLEKAYRENDMGAFSLLERNGIALKSRVGRWVLYVATNSAKVGALFRDTSFESGYATYIRRHKFAVHDGRCDDRKGKDMLFAGARHRAQGIDWTKFRECYMKEQDDELGGEVPF